LVPLGKAVPESAPEFVRAVTATLIADLGDSLPVSLMPADGTWPTTRGATAAADTASAACAAAAADLSRRSCADTGRT
jgi:hypothetical protein